LKFKITLRTAGTEVSHEIEAVNFGSAVSIARWQIDKSTAEAESLAVESMPDEDCE